MKKKLVVDAKKLLGEGHVPKNRWRTVWPSCFLTELPRVSTKVEGEEGEEELDIFSPLTTNPRQCSAVQCILVQLQLSYCTVQCSVNNYLAQPQKCSSDQGIIRLHMCGVSKPVSRNDVMIRAACFSCDFARYLMALD